MHFALDGDGIVSTSPPEVPEPSEKVKWTCVSKQG